MVILSQWKEVLFASRHSLLSLLVDLLAAFQVQKRTKETFILRGYKAFVYYEINTSASYSYLICRGGRWVVCRHSQRPPHATTRVAITCQILTLVLASGINRTTIFFLKRATSISYYWHGKPGALTLSGASAFGPATSIFSDASRIASAGIGAASAATGAKAENTAKTPLDPRGCFVGIYSAHRGR